MKKIPLSRVFFLLSAGLMAVFAGAAVWDYCRYDQIFTAAPYWVFLLVHAATFLFPAALLLAGGAFLRRTERKKTK